MFLPNLLSICQPTNELVFSVVRVCLKYSLITVSLEDGIIALKKF